MSQREHIDALLRRFAESGPVGCAMAVAQYGKTVYTGYAGFADREAARPVGPETTYRLYSMTKLVTVTAGMILYERGAFLLNEPLSLYLPEYAHMQVAVPDGQGRWTTVPAERPITVGDCFAMTCGLPYRGGDSPTRIAIGKYDDALRANGCFTLRDFVRGLSKVPLAFEPGTRWAYGHGHELVAALVEVLSGRAIGRFMKDEIFGPLGMEHTGYRWQGDDGKNMAVLYRRNEEGALVPDRAADGDFAPDATFEGGGHGLYATLGDYLTFTQMLANGGTLKGTRILGRATIDLMRANRLGPGQLEDFTFPYVAGYGYGLGVRTMMDPAAGGSNTPVGEFGWTGAAGTWASIDPSHGFSAVYMHQMFPNMEEYHHLRARAAAYALL
ncbi:MAG: beta-lactamase family protein [Clostridiales bacterium]|nr:beta-lactamase family protein [Clostridiales bacterium]